MSIFRIVKLSVVRLSEGDDRAITISCLDENSDKGSFQISGLTRETELTLEDLFAISEATSEVGKQWFESLKDKSDSCSSCNGVGTSDPLGTGEWASCRHCNGTGQIPVILD